MPRVIKNNMDDETIKEPSKAIQEVAKLGNQSIKTTEKILGFFAKIFRKPIEQISGIVTDRIIFYRIKKLIPIIDEVQKILDERNIEETRAISPKFAIPILESASLEDDEELQKIWARLIANSIDPEFNIEMRFAFIEIIKSLNPLDAKMLNYFYNILFQDPKVDFNVIENYNLKKDQICAGLGIDSEEYLVSVYNLFRVQCLAPAILKGGVSMGNEPLTIFKGAEAVTMTPLGKMFVETCIKE